MEAFVVLTLAVLCAVLSIPLNRGRRDDTEQLL
jgi:hypothetical protein